MPATFKTEQQIYDDVLAYIQAQIPTLTSWAPGSFERAFARAIAYACTMMWKILFICYQNIWATLADVAGLRNWYEVFGMTWTGEQEVDARLQVLARFRERSLGTANWYEVTAVAQFDDVTEAHFIAGVYGVNTAALLILSHGSDCMEDTITDVQAYFDNVQRKVVTIDVRVITYRDVEEMMELLAAGTT